MILSKTQFFTRDCYAIQIKDIYTFIYINNNKKKSKNNFRMSANELGNAVKSILVLANAPRE